MVALSFSLCIFLLLINLAPPFVPVGFLIVELNLRAYTKRRGEREREREREREKERKASL